MSLFDNLNTKDDTLSEAEQDALNSGIYELFNFEEEELEEDDYYSEDED